jgi:hypothetical protein
MPAIADISVGGHDDGEPLAIREGLSGRALFPRKSERVSVEDSGRRSWWTLDAFLPAAGGHLAESCVLRVARGCHAGVANGDTGVHEWDDTPRSAMEFDLGHWRSDSAAA